MCVRIHRQDSPRPFAAFQIREEKPDRENPLTVFCFLNITDRVLFSKQRGEALVLFSKPVRVSEPTLFCFLNRSRARSPYACACVHKPTRRRHQKTAEKGAFALFKPYKAAVSHFMGAIDRFIVWHLFVSYNGFYGRGRERGYTPHTPPRYQRERQGVHFKPPYIVNIAQGV